MWILLDGSVSLFSSELLLLEHQYSQPGSAKRLCYAFIQRKKVGEGLINRGTGNMLIIFINNEPMFSGSGVLICLTGGREELLAILLVGP
jgi:hypothetical protein